MPRNLKTDKQFERLKPELFVSKSSASIFAVICSTWNSSKVYSSDFQKPLNCFLKIMWTHFKSFWTKTGNSKNEQKVILR